MAGFFIFKFHSEGAGIMAREEINVEQLIRKNKAYNEVAFKKLKDAKEDSKNIFNQYFFQEKGREHGADSVFYDPYFVSGRFDHRR